MTGPRVEALIKKAEETNSRRSEMERAAGFAPPEDCSPDVQLRTVMLAMLSGMEAQSWESVAEAFVMAKSLHKTVTGEDYVPDRVH